MKRPRIARRPARSIEFAHDEPSVALQDGVWQLAGIGIEALALASSALKADVTQLTLCTGGGVQEPPMISTFGQ